MIEALRPKPHQDPQSQNLYLQSQHQGHQLGVLRHFKHHDGLLESSFSASFSQRGTEIMLISPLPADISSRYGDHDSGEKTLASSSTLCYHKPSSDAPPICSFLLLACPLSAASGCPHQICYTPWSRTPKIGAKLLFTLSDYGCSLPGWWATKSKKTALAGHTE